MCAFEDYSEVVNREYVFTYNAYTCLWETIVFFYVFNTDVYFYGCQASVILSKRMYLFEFQKKQKKIFRFGHNIQYYNYIGTNDNL